MFREVREIKEVDELGIKEINEGKALIYIRSVVEYDKGYNNLNSDLKKYFSACINWNCWSCSSWDRIWNL